VNTDEGSRRLRQNAKFDFEVIGNFCHVLREAQHHAFLLSKHLQSPEWDCLYSFWMHCKLREEKLLKKFIGRWRVRAVCAGGSDNST
jgi:hypothetical protein